MDINSHNINNTESNKLDMLLKRKKLLGGIAAAIVIVFIITLLLPSSSPVNKDKSKSAEDVYLNALGTPGPTHTPDLKDAIKEAESAADEYGNMLEETSYDYPWLRKFPLVSDKFYVYYDTEKIAFVADIFLGPQDNAENVKAEIQKQIQEITEVPAENFQFEWNVK